MENNSKRQLWVDYLKAVSCLAVVMFHVIYGLQNAGVYTHGYTNICKDFCDIFQIPLFFMASGYLYGTRKTPDKYFQFEIRKLITLGVPYIVFSYVYILVNTIFSGSVNFSYDAATILKVPIQPIAQYWFLFALMLIFFFVVAIEKLFELIKIDRIAKLEYIVFSIFVVWKILVINMFLLGDKVLNVDYYIAGYGIFFYLGVLYARRHNDFSVLRNKKTMICLVIIFLVSFSLFELRPQLQIRIDDIIRLVVNIVAIITMTILFELCWEKFQCKFLKLISKYSFQIYLLHTMATAACRIVLLKLGIGNDLIHLVAGIIVGLSVSICAAIICEKSIYLNILFFPLSTMKKIKAKKM